MKAAVPPTGNRRTRHPRSSNVAVPRRLMPVSGLTLRSRTPDGATPRSDNKSPRRLRHSVDLAESSGLAPELSNGPRRPADTVRVAVRCRPMNQMERARGDLPIFRLPSKECTSLQMVSSTGGSNTSSSSGARELVRNFQFDLCASEDLTQGQFFRASGVIPLLESVVDGYLATVFAYGQTGSGKTYTMSGLDELIAGAESREQRAGISAPTTQLSDGLIPRSLKHLFALLEQAPTEVKAVVRASYCEIYNEQVFDLLNPGSGSLNVRWNARAGFYVQDLLVVRCDSLSDVLAVVNEGHRNRRVSGHGMNTDSSRSHSLLTVHVDRTETRESDSGGSHGITRYGKMSFVDLAGSERLKETRSTNTEETSSINRSLLTLGKVISALAASSSASNDASANTNNFIPYRDSKLTKLLMDSLGGQSLTLMIACVSPSGATLDDTLSTLKYATRAKNIRNKPAVQVDPVELELSNLRHENQALRAENNALRLRLQLSGTTSSNQFYFQHQSSLASAPSSSRLSPLNLSPISRSPSKPFSVSPSRVPEAQRNQFHALQHDHQKLAQHAAASEQRIRQLEAENKVLRESQEQGQLLSYQQNGSSPAKGGWNNAMKQLQEQVRQLQQREQELMQALSRRSRGRRDTT